jgi:hypothetical protein
MTRRITHTSQHRGHLLATLRMLGHDMYSTYGPTADTGGLTIYAYKTLEAMLEGGSKSALPPTERPDV